MNVEEFKKTYDLAIFAFNFETASNNTVIRLTWKGGLTGSSSPWFSREIPTLAVSFANPYRLVDVPQVKTFINAYTFNEYTLPAVMDKLMGLSPFTGISPVDPFCGKLDTRF